LQRTANSHFGEPINDESFDCGQKLIDHAKKEWLDSIVREGFTVIVPPLYT
jgi:hypothetical protein